MVWTLRLSVTSSRLLPTFDFVGLDQYRRLLSLPRFIDSAQNLVIFGILFIAGCLILGFLLAVFIDQRVRAEGVFRAVFLFPHAMSFVVTGLAWQWFLNPQLGLQKLVRDWGFDGFTFDWIVNREMAIYTIVIAGIWQSAGLVMAIPTWQVYLRIVLPLLQPMIVTSVVLLSVAVIKLYDLVVAMTQGGPGGATEVPAKFVMDSLFQRANVGLATACASVMLVTVLAVLAPWLYARTRGQRPA